MVVAIADEILSATSSHIHQRRTLTYPTCPLLTKFVCWYKSTGVLRPSTDNVDLVPPKHRDDHDQPAMHDLPHHAGRRPVRVQGRLQTRKDVCSMPRATPCRLRRKNTEHTPGESRAALAAAAAAWPRRPCRNQPRCESGVIAAAEDTPKKLAIYDRSALITVLMRVRPCCSHVSPGHLHTGGRIIAHVNVWNAGWSHEAVARHD